MYNFVKSNFIKRQNKWKIKTITGTKNKKNKFTQQKAKMVSQEKVIMKVVVMLVAVIFLSTRVEAEMSVRSQTYTISLKNCNYSEEELTSTPQPSVEICAVYCMETERCKSFASRGADCGVLTTCPESCTKVTGSNESWNIYCPEGKAI